MNNTVINSILYAITVISNYFVCYNREILLIKYAKPNQTTQFVRYNCVFVITVIVITEFDCSFLKIYAEVEIPMASNLRPLCDKTLVNL